MKKITIKAFFIGLILTSAGSAQADVSWFQWIKNGFSSLKIQNINPKKVIKIAAGIVGGYILGASIAYLARYYTYTLDPNRLSGESLLNYLRAKYKPNKEKCGAAITQANDRLPDDFWAALICLVDGHRDIYWSSQADLTSNIDQILNKANIGIIKFRRRIPPVFQDQYGKSYRIKNCPSNGIISNEMILYTPKGKTNALLLQKYLTNLRGINFNDYLMGTLLGYNEKDMEYYDTTKNKRPFYVDKKEAIEWLTTN